MKLKRIGILIPKKHPQNDEDAELELCPNDSCFPI